MNAQDVARIYPQRPSGLNGPVLTIKIMPTVDICWGSVRESTAEGKLRGHSRHTDMSDDIQKIADTFNERAAGYAGGAWHRIYAERLVDLANLQPGQSILDAGAGTGFAALAIARRVGPSGRVVAVDISTGMLAEVRAAAAAAGITNIEILQANAADLSRFPTSSFDAAICAAALLYMPVQRALAEWHRVLAPGGLVGFSTMSAGSPPAGQMFRDCAAAFGMRLTDPSAALGSEDRCRAALHAAGFRDISIVGEHIDFSPADLARAWDSNSRSASHAAVRELSESDRETLRVRYEDALRARLTADPSFARADVFYAFGRK
jgi:ubiquinone/menaquinone biosynthesis C-methylase UbiE